MTLIKTLKDYVESLPSFYEASRTNDYSVTDKQMKLLAQNGGGTIVALNRLDRKVNENTTAIVKDSEKDSSQSINEIIVVSLVGVLFKYYYSIFLNETNCKFCSQGCKKCRYFNNVCCRNTKLY